jgi:glycosyltransferase involved in cell wall biosynthesis
MRIAILVDRLVLGGLETHLVTFINELLWRGHQIFLYTGIANPEIITQIDYRKDRFSHCNWGEDSITDLQKFSPDIIHAHPFQAINKGYLIAKELQIPLIITIHGLYDAGLGQLPEGDEITNYAASIIAVDQGVEAYLKNYLTCPEKLAVIRNGINLCYFHPKKNKSSLRSKYGLQPDWFTLCGISRFENQKELPLLQLLRCAPSLAEQFNGLNIILVGDGLRYYEVKEAADSLSDFNNINVKVVGRQNDVRDFLNLSDLVIACDRAALEAMACQKPVFAANANGFAGLITKNNYHKILSFRAGYQNIRDQELIVSLLDLAANPNQLKNTATEGLKIIQQYYNILNVVNQLEEIYGYAITRNSKDN